MKQDKYDNTPAPKIKCRECNIIMQSSTKLLRDYPEDKPLRMSFILECQKCKKRKSFYDNGEEQIFEPELCPKCNKVVTRSYKLKSNISTITTKCSSCNYNKVEIDDWNKSSAERKQKEAKDKESLTKYRNEFCLTKEKAEEYIDLFDQIEFANEVYEFELQKFEDPVYERTANIKKLNIVELEKILSEELVKNRYQNLSFSNPEIGRFVIVPFVLQDVDASRKNKESCRQLERIIKPILEKTNWRLIPNSIYYRLAYVSGRLKGYERDEDLHEVLGKMKQNPKKELDPKKLEKYDHSNVVEIARMNAKFRAVENIRKKRLEKEPDGFFLEDREGGNYSCHICNNYIPGSRTWWTPEGLTCPNCHRNIKDGVISDEIMKNEKIWFKSWGLEQEFDLHSATIRKLTRNGELVGRQLKDEEGRIYCTIYMAEDNQKFFKTHQRKSERKQKWYFVDKDGKIIWL